MQARKLSTDTPLVHMGNLTLGDFWSWAYSDLLSNGNRSVFAEFMVGAVLGVIATPRREWDAVDLRYGDKTIEVKASAYTQSWEPVAHPSPIRFDIGKKLPWDAQTNQTGVTRRRSADCYVFCLHNEQDREQALLRMLDATSWIFYVVATGRLERQFGDQKSVSLTALARLCEPVSYARLKAAVDSALSGTAGGSATP
ncbi:MAG TPA: hypothetical protein VE338_04010 [Ktedonobacterales bacterium]|jgi:hypothetical protein|nr:hypothetical protein [Ktedonobacterales bacterium]